MSRSTYTPVHPVAFLHVPKSAGSSLTMALSDALAPQSTFAAIDRCMFGTFSAFEYLSEQCRSSILFEASAIPSHADFLAGHLSLSRLWEGSPRAQVITLLREPTSRLISLWVYWRSLPSSFHDQWRPWSETVQLCRLPLRDFLRAPRLACQIDNQVLRLLLWPHPLIPNNDWIDESHDASLLDEARSRLERLHFVDVIENPALIDNLAGWLGRPLVLQRLNETEGVPESLKTSMANELDSMTSARLASLSRLDAALWSTVVSQRMPNVDWHALRERTLARNLSIYSRLMAPSA